MQIFDKEQRKIKEVPKVVRSCNYFFFNYLSLGSVGKNLPTMQEIQVLSLGWKDPLEKEMAIHSSILAWEISWAEQTGGLQSMESQRVRQD